MHRSISPILRYEKYIQPPPKHMKIPASRPETEILFKSRQQNKITSNSTVATLSMKSDRIRSSVQISSHDDVSPDEGEQDENASSQSSRTMSSKLTTSTSRPRTGPDENHAFQISDNESMSYDETEDKNDDPVVVISSQEWQGAAAAKKNTTSNNTPRVIPAKARLLEKRRYQGQIDQLKKDQKKLKTEKRERKTIVNNLTAETTRLKQENERVKAKRVEEGQTLKREYESKIRELELVRDRLKMEHKSEVQELKLQHEKEIQELKLEHEEEKNELEREVMKEKQEMKLDMEKEKLEIRLGREKEKTKLQQKIQRLKLELVSITPAHPLGGEAS